MSSLERDRDYDTISTAVHFAFNQWMKDVYTAMPGVVVSYDAATQRAVVRGALALVLTDGSRRARPEIADVPVVFPSGGGYSLIVPLEAGDPVLLVFSQRGLTAWKTAYRDAVPDVGHYFDAEDAVAIPGFGKVGGVAPAVPDAMVIQSNDGAHYIGVNERGIEASESLGGWEVSATAPSNPEEGDGWYDTGVDELKVWDGAEWASMATVETDSTITGTGSDASPLAVANPFTDADEAKLDGLPSSALSSVATDSTISGDGTSGSPLAVANPFTAADESKLDGIDTAATAGAVSDATLTGTGITGSPLSVVDQVPSQATAPSSPSEGDLWYDTSTDELKAYDGSAWQVIGPGGSSGGGGGGFTRQGAANIAWSPFRTSSNFVVEFDVTGVTIPADADWIVISLGFRAESSYQWFSASEWRALTATSGSAGADSTNSLYAQWGDTHFRIGRSATNGLRLGTGSWTESGLTINVFTGSLGGGSGGGGVGPQGPQGPPGPAGAGTGWTSSASAPASPSEGAGWYDTGNDRLSIYDGSTWDVIGPGSTSGGGGAGWTVAAVAPTGQSDGDGWYDTANDALKIYDGSAWETVGSGLDTAAVNRLINAHAGQPNVHHTPPAASGGGSGWTVSATAPVQRTGTTTLYAIDDATNSLYTINVASGRATLVGSAQSLGNLQWVGMTSLQGTLYAIGYDTNVRANLYRINPNNGIRTRIGALGALSTGDVWSALGASSNTLYAIKQAHTGPGLYTINPSTGTATQVGTRLDAAALTGLAWRSLGGLRGVMYGITQSAGRIATVNRSDATISYIGAANALGAGATWHSLAYHNGNLYSIRVSGTSPNFTYRLCRINRTTSVPTAIGSSNLGLPTGSRSWNAMASHTEIISHADGTGWYDTANDELKIWDGSRWETIGPGGSSSGGSTTFRGLTDTPGSYSGQAGKHVAVNSGASALIFVDAPQATTTSDKNWVSQANAPTSPSDGDGWYDTATDELKIYDGTQWEVIGSAGTAPSTGLTSTQVDTKIEAHRADADAHQALRTQAQTIALIGAPATNKSGLVPQLPSSNQTTRFLRGDGTWAVPAGGTGGGLTTTQVTALITAHAGQPNVHHTPPAAGGGGWIVSSTQPGQAATLYVIDDVTDDLYTVNTGTGRATQIGTGRRNISVGGMASLAGVLYAVDNTSDTLGRVNPTNFGGTGGFAIVGSSGAMGAGSWHSLAALGGQLYSVETARDELHRVDAVAGTTTRVGSMGTGTWFALTGHGGTLYAINDANNNLYTVNSLTGATTLIGSMGTAIWTGLTSHNGTLYAISTTSLYTVNIATRRVTRVGSLGLTRAYCIASHGTGGVANEGDGWYDTTANALKIYNGSSWVTV